MLLVILGQGADETHAPNVLANVILEYSQTHLIAAPSSSSCAAAAAAPTTAAASSAKTSPAGITERGAWEAEQAYRYNAALDDSGVQRR